MAWRAPLADIQFTLDLLETSSALADTGAFPDLSDDLSEAILEEAGKLATDALSPLNVKGDEDGARLEGGSVIETPGFRDVYKTFVEAGWGALPWPPEHGGQGLPLTLAAALTDMWNGANAAWGLCPMLTEGAIKALIHHGSSELQEKYLPKLISGEWTGSMNLTEAQAGSDVGALRARAEAVGDGTYRIKGTKIFITWGEHDMAENIIHLVLARLPDAPHGTRGISLFLVPKFFVNDDGSLGARNDVKCLKLEEKLGIHGSPTCVLEFGEDEGAIGWLIGEENRGMACMFTMMNSARLNIGIQAMAIGDAAYQKALEYANERTQGKPFGKQHEQKDMVPIIAHPDVRRNLIHIKSHVEAARGICYANALAADLAERSSDEAVARDNKGLEELLTPISKAWSSDIAVEAASIGVQVHGGMGFVEETGAAQFLRDARITPIYEGTNGIHGIDLSIRKLSLEGGEVMSRYIDDVTQYATQLSNSEDDTLGLIGGSLLHAAQGLHEAFDWMREQLKVAPENTLAGATPYLRLFGNVAGGFYLAKGAELAANRLASGEGDPAHSKERIAIARFFAENVLPLAGGLLASVCAGAETLEGFGAAS